MAFEVPRGAPALCEEALRLGRILAEMAPAEPEVHGLVALMGLVTNKKAWQRPTLPPSSGSTIGAAGLNFRVRDGNGWFPCAIVTRH